MRRSMRGREKRNAGRARARLEGNDSHAFATGMPVFTLGQALIVSREATKPRQPAKASLHHQRRGSSTKPFFASGSFTICKSMSHSAFTCARSCSPAADDPGEDVHGYVHHAAALALVAVAARTWAAFAVRLQRSAVHDYGAGLAQRHHKNADEPPVPAYPIPQYRYEGKSQ